MNISIALSALQASRLALDNVSHNIANANLPGYHRQRVHFEARAPQWFSGHYLGSGVQVARIDRLRAQVLENSFTTSLSDLHSARQGLTILRQIEAEFMAGDGSIHQSLTQFFGELNRLSANPHESVSRHGVIEKASFLAQQIQNSYHRLSDLKMNVQAQIFAEVETLNQQLVELVDLQRRIREASVGGVVPHDLHDQRDRLINLIAERIDIQRFEMVEQGFGLSLASSAISLGVTPVQFQAIVKQDGTIAVQLAGTDRDMTFQSGRLAALMEAYNATINSYQAKLNQLAGSLMREFDQAHAKGVGLGGPFTLMRGVRNFNAVDVPLKHAGLAFPVSRGELYFSITDLHGEKRTYAVFIDPAVDSIQDVAQKISSLPDVTASIDTHNRQLAIFARPGYRFDFTGNLETIPGLGSFTGTAVPRFSGRYQGTSNRQVQVEILGSGQIGRTPGLTARVTDLQTGSVIADLNIGDGYEAGSTQAVADGVQLSFSAGTVVAGDTFTTTLVAEPDATGILAALGLNSLFTGRGAVDMKVATRLLENPNELAVSRTGDIADTDNLMRMIRLRDARVLGDQKLTFQDFLGDVTSHIGFQVRSQQRLEQNISAVNKQWENDIAAFSGVDLNEELVNMVQFQKQYEAVLQVLRAFDAMLSELMTIIR